MVNLSLGTRFGPKDGTSIFEQFLTAQANNPALGLGRVIVKSASNDGYVQGITDQEYKKYHGRLSGNGYLDFETTGFQTFNNNEFFISDAWYPELENFRISIDPPGQARILLNNGTWGNDISTYSFGKGEGTGDPGYGWITEKGLVSIHNDHFGANDPFPFTPDNQIIIIVQDVTYNNNTYHVPNGTWRASMSNGFGDWDMYLDAPESQLYFHSNYSGILPQRAQRAQRYKKLAKKTCLVEKDVPQAGKTILNALHEVVDTQNSSSVASVISVAE